MLGVGVESGVRVKGEMEPVRVEPATLEAPGEPGERSEAPVAASLTTMIRVRVRWLHP